MIVAAVLPLVAEHGATVTTSQIAQAAGIGEATVFRAFRDKDELLAACLAEALRPDSALAALAEIPLDLPLADRLREAADTLQTHLTRVGRVIGALHGTRPRREPEQRPDQRGQGPGRDESMARTRDALADLFAPEADRLRLPADQVATAFLGVLMARSRGADLPLDAAIDMFLHGALRDPKADSEEDTA